MESLKKYGILLGLCLQLVSGVALAQEQIVTAQPGFVPTAPSQEFTVSLYYTTLPEQPNLTGLGLRIHYDARAIVFLGFDDIFEFGNLAVGQPVEDVADFDNDPLTNQFIALSWLDPIGDWPGQVQALLARVNFIVNFSFEGVTRVRMSANSTAPGFGFDSQVIVVSSGPEEIFFPQYGDGAGFISTVVIINPDPFFSATGVVELFDPVGNPLPQTINGVERNGSFEFVIEPLGVSFFSSAGQGDLVVGSAVIRSDRAVDGTILFSGTVGVAGVPAGKPSAAFVIPLEVDSSLQVNTGLAVSNPLDTEQTATVLLLSDRGRELDRIEIVLPPRGRTAMFPDQLFLNTTVDLQSFKGGIRVQSQAIVGMAIRTSPGHFATLPVSIIR